MKDHSFGEQVLKDTASTGKKERVIDMAQNAWGDMPARGVQKNDRANNASEVKDTAKVSESHKSHDLVEASHRIKLLNNELHKPGGPLASSALELVGFDKSGRLLLVQRDHTGKVDGKYLVDSDSGKIVARTEHGHLDKWEHGPGYDKAHSESKGQLKRDSQGRVSEVEDGFGDKRKYTRDLSGQVTEITMTQIGFEPVAYRPGTGVAEVSNHLWYKQPHTADEQVRGFKFEVKDDGTLLKYTTVSDFEIFKPDGSIVEMHNGVAKVTRKAQF